MTDKEDSNFPIVSEGEIGRTTVQTVNARDLHAFLEVRRDFSTWIKDRIEQYGFLEGQDFIEVFPQTGKNSSGGRPAREYHISLDTAKELSMVERNEKGKQARQYFIAMEKRAKSVPMMIDLNDPAQLRPLLASYAERAQIAEAKLIEFQPKIEAFDRLDAADGCLTVRPAAKVLGFPERQLTKWMEVHRWAFRQSGKGPLQAYVEKRNSGFLDHKLETYADPKTGEEKVRATLVVTPKGLSRLAQVLPSTGGHA